MSASLPSASVPSYSPLVLAEKMSSMTLTQNDEDEILIHHIANRDVHAIEQLYDRYSGALYALILRIVKDANAAEGLVQETFLQVWQKANDYTGIGVPGAWIFRIARNKALDHLRRGKVRPVSADKEIEAHYDLTEHGSDEPLTLIETHVEQGYHRQHLHTALAEIPQEQRYCLELAYFEGMSQREIAIHTNTPIGTIKTRIKMGMQKMERLLRSYGYTNATGMQ
jgi:RNA polymerase sigma-70 factor (ECF subfamily)